MQSALTSGCCLPANCGCNPRAIRRPWPQNEVPPAADHRATHTESKTTVIILGSVFGGVGLIGLVFLIYCLVLKKGNLIKSSKLEKLTRKINSDSTGELIVND